MPRRASSTRLRLAGRGFGRVSKVACAALLVAGLGMPLAAAAADQGAGIEPAPGGRRFGKIGSALTRVYESHLVGRVTGLPEGFRSPLLMVARDEEYVTIDALAIDGDGEGLLLELEALGLRAGAHFKHMASGRFPVANLPLLEGVSKLRFARPYYTMAYAGSVQTQGDAAMHTDAVRFAEGLSGAGVTVGAISTSFDCIEPPGDGTPPPLWTDYAADQLSSELPPGVVNLQELDEDLNSGAGLCEPSTLATDEGRAMLQIVHDVAPGASLLFHSGGNGQADFAQGILDLRDNGADVITDDLGVANEPFFQDGIIAQAIDQVVSDGVTYFSAAGNWANLALTTSATGRWTTDPIFGKTAFDFNPGGGVDHYLRFNVPVVSDASDAGGLIFLLHWDQPYASATGGAGATSELALYIEDTDLNTAGAPPTAGGDPGNVCGVGANGSPDGNEPNVGADPLEVLQFVNASGLPGGPCGIAPVPKTLFNVYIELVSGPEPDLISLMILAPVLGSAAQFTIQDVALFPGGGTIFGHANAAGAITVGAANYQQTPAFGQSPPLLASYSSVGPPVPILFDGNDDPLGTSLVRPKPELVCPDGADVSFDPCGTLPLPGSPPLVPPSTAYLCFIAADTADAGTFPNFFGTSAAAAHCAGGAALLLEKDPSQFPLDVADNLIAQAIDMGPAGLDSATGWGLVRLDKTAASIACTASGGVDLVLPGPLAVSTELLAEACYSIVAADVTVEGAGDLTFSAGYRIELQNGFTIEAGGSFSAVLD
jgi:hypothetical protein